MKTKEEEFILKELEEVFKNLNKINLNKILEIKDNKIKSKNGTRE